MWTKNIDTFNNTLNICDLIHESKYCVLATIRAHLFFETTGNIHKNLPYQIGHKENLNQLPTVKYIPNSLIIIQQKSENNKKQKLMLPGGEKDVAKMVFRGNFTVLNAFVWKFKMTNKNYFFKKSEWHIDHLNHYIHIRMAQLRKTNQIKCWQTMQWP